MVAGSWKWSEMCCGIFFWGNGWKVVANNSFQNVRPWFATWRNECQVYEIFLAGSLLLCWLPRSMAIALALKATNDPNSCRTGDHQRAQKTMYPQEESNRNTQLRNKYKCFIFLPPLDMNAPFIINTAWAPSFSIQYFSIVVANRQAKKCSKTLKPEKNWNNQTVRMESSAASHLNNLPRQIFY